MKTELSSDVTMYEIDSHPQDPVSFFEFFLHKLGPDDPNSFVKSKKTFSKEDIR